MTMANMNGGRKQKAASHLDHVSVSTNRVATSTHLDVPKGSTELQAHANRTKTTVSDKHVGDHHLPNRRRRRRTAASSTRTYSSNASRNCCCNSTDLVGFLCLFLYGFYLQHTQHVLDKQLSVYPERALLWDTHTSVSPTTTTHTKRPKSSVQPPASDYYINDGHQYLVFRPIVSGQGLGNHMQGLLATHLLGHEFNRTVCVTRDWNEFHIAMQHVDSSIQKRCDRLPRQGNLDNTIVLVNFADPPNECWLKERLASTTTTTTTTGSSNTSNQDGTIYYITANTYPRWTSQPDNFFQRYYKPTAALQKLLPLVDGGAPPDTVVHLRRPDTPETDARQGLDSETFQALGQMLPRNRTFLVTNDVSLYRYFEDEFGWKHPNWTLVRHSAYPDEIVWGIESPVDEQNIQEDAATRRDDNNDATKTDSITETLQLWSDWYTISTAKHVYHTHSDFSLSAIHWNNIVDSKTLVGGVNTTDGKMVPNLSDEPWRRDGEMKRLVDRVEEELYLCNQTVTELDFMQQALAGLDGMGDDDILWGQDDPMLQDVHRDLDPAIEKLILEDHVEEEEVLPV